VERLQGSERVQAIRASDHVHQTSEELGSDEGLSLEQMEALEATRPGKLPRET